MRRWLSVSVLSVGVGCSLQAMAVELPFVDDFSTNTVMWQTVPDATPSAISGDEGEALIAGAVMQALDTPVVVRTNAMTSAVEFLLPENSADFEWSSVAITFYGQDPAQRQYAMLIFETPYISGDSRELGFHPQTMLPMSLPSGQWYVLKVSAESGYARLKIWPRGEAEPTAWQVEGRINLDEIHGIGLRTYAATVRVDNFSFDAQPGFDIDFSSPDETVHAVVTSWGALQSLKLADQDIPFDIGAHSGPTWQLDNRTVDLEPVDGSRGRFVGSAGALHVALEVEARNGGEFGLRCELTNNGSERETLRASIRLGIDTYMASYPQWNDHYFPTLMRCEKTHFWGYFQSPLGKVVAISSRQPVASYRLAYNSPGHRIYTVYLDLLQPGVLPARHPVAADGIAAGETKVWELELQAVDTLDAVKPAIAERLAAPMFELERYTVAAGETVKGTIYGGELNALELITPAGVRSVLSSRPDVPGDTMQRFAFTPSDGAGQYTLLATGTNGMLSEATASVRKPWSWYLKKARENAISKPQKASITVESWYGFYSMWLAQKHFPNSALDAQSEAKYDEIFPLLFAGNGNTMTIYGDSRPQNQALTAGMEADRYEATGNIHALERAAAMCDLLCNEFQDDTGAYRDPRAGVYYTSVGYMAKSVLEVAMVEKTLADNSTIWDERYRRHLDSGRRAIADLVRRRTNIETEGEATFEDGMISCSYSQIAFGALYFASEEERPAMIQAALDILAGHACLSQKLIPDSRMNGGSLRYWESQYDVYMTPNMMNSPHGWSAWRIYGLYYLYLLTGDEALLRDAFNALGSCVQLMDPTTGNLRWAFVCDPYIEAHQHVENPDQPGTGIHVDRIVGEEYIPMTSGWNRAPEGQAVNWYGNDDNDVHEVFKCLEEVALTQAFVVERKDGELVGYNCSVVTAGNTVTVTPHEDIVTRVHCNFRQAHDVVVAFTSAPLTQNVSVGLHWLNRMPTRSTVLILK